MAEIIELTYDGERVLQGDDVLAVGESIPCGMGSLELCNTAKAGLHVVRLSSSGGFVYSVRLNRAGDYRFGPNYGHRVKPSEEEQNPMRRVLRELGLSIQLLVEVEGSIEVSEHYADLWKAYPVGSTSWRWETDGIVSLLSVEEVQGVWETDHVISINGATYALKVVDEVPRGGSSFVYTRIGEIRVWDGCDPVTLKAAIEKALDS